MGFIKNIRKVFTYIDIYGERINLKIKKNSSSDTFIGGVLTFLTFTLLTVAAWTTGRDILYKTKPSINLEDKLLIQRSNLTLDKHSFPFSIALQDDSNNVYYYPQYFKFEVLSNSVSNVDGTSSLTSLELESCRSSHFPKFSEDLFNSTGMSRYWCVKDQNLTVGGYWDELSIKYAIIRIKLCKNETSNNTCAPIEEIINFMNIRALSWCIYIQNSIINTKNYNEPVSFFILNLYKNIRISSTKLYNVFIREQQIETDKGIIFEDFEIKSSMAYDFADNDDNDPTDIGTLLDINLFSTNHMPIFHRNYLKVQTLLANLGGLAKALMIFSYIFSFYFSRFKRNKLILNKIFDFALNETERKQVTLGNTIIDNQISISKSWTNIKNQEYNVTSNNKLASISNFKNSLAKPHVKKKTINAFDEKVTINKVMDDLNKRKDVFKLNMNFIEIIKFIFCKKCLKGNLKSKFILYSKSHNDLDELLDISIIIKKLDEFEKLKLILLNHEQIAMFQFLAKQLCTLNAHEKQKSELILYKELIKDEEKLLNLILNYKNQLIGKPSTIDKKLFGLLNEEVKILGKF